MGTTTSPYSTIYAFGDSLSDAGDANLLTSSGLAAILGLPVEPVSPPYYQEAYGTITANVFSNGPIWVQDLGHALGITPTIAPGTVGVSASTLLGLLISLGGQYAADAGVIVAGLAAAEGASGPDPYLVLAPGAAGGTDFAIGGSVTGPTAENTGLTVPVTDLSAQLANFQATIPTPAPNALYTVWSGSNDLLNLLSDPDFAALSPATIAGDVAASVTNEVAAVDALVAGGAKSVLVVDVGDLGDAPSITQSGLPPATEAALAQAASALSLAFDGALATALQQTNFSTANVTLEDTYGVINAAVTFPAAFGLTNVTTPVYTGGFAQDTGTTVLTNQDQYLFFDQLHPTETAQTLTAETALATLGLTGDALPGLVSQGSAKTHSTLTGTPGDDILIATAAFTTIVGGGGSDIIEGQTGYDTVKAGTPGDGATTLTETITLAGQDSTVIGGDENFSIMDLVGGLNTITLGDGSDNVVLAGAYNTVSAGGGQDNDFSFTGGSTTLSIAQATASSLTPYSDHVTFAGTNNRLDLDVEQFSAGQSSYNPGSLVVTGGDGNGAFKVLQGLVSLTTGGLYNTVILGDGTGDITPGSGHDTVDIDAAAGPMNAVGGDFTIHLAGQNNYVTAVAHTLSITGSSYSSTFQLSNALEDVANFYAGGPARSYTVAAGGSFNKFTLDDTNTNTITTGQDGATVTIYDPAIPGLGTVGSAGLHASSLTLDGIDNVVTDDGLAALNVAGGTGRGTFLLGGGNDILTTGGLNNVVTAGAGTDVINAGSGNDTVVLNGTNVLATASGAGDKITFNSGAQGSVIDVSQGLRVTAAAGVGAIDLLGLASDPKFVIDLIGGAGGYTTATQAAMAVQSDGMGGSILGLGAGSIHFEGVATVLAGVFRIN